MFSHIKKTLIAGILTPFFVLGVTVSAFMASESFQETAAANPPPPELGAPKDPWVAESTCAVQDQYYGGITKVQYLGGLCNQAEVALKEMAVAARLKYLQDLYGPRFRPSSNPASPQYVDSFGLDLGVPGPCHPWFGPEDAAGNAVRVYPIGQCDPIAVSYNGLYAGPGSEQMALQAATLSFNGASTTSGPRSQIISNPADPCYGKEVIVCAAIRGGYILENDK